MADDLRMVVATAIYNGGEPDWLSTVDGTANAASYELADRAIEALMPTYLTVNEVATHMRVSKMTIYRMIESGELRGIKFGRSFRVRSSDLHAYLEDNQTGGSDEVRGRS